MPISLLDESLKIEIYFDALECEFDDCICVECAEDCPDDEKIFRGDQTNIYVTVEQARALIQALTEAISKAEA